MIHALVHSVLHAAHEGSIIVLGIILIIATLALVVFILSLYAHTFYNGWTEPSTLQALQGESPEQYLKRSRIALLSPIEMTLDEANPPMSLNFFRDNTRAKLALAYLALLYSIVPSVHAYRYVSNAWYLETHQQAPAPALEHEAPVERTS